MQIPERPFDGGAPDDGTPSYKWLDEWLCEYVDGTMDPSLEAVFEQYVEANPKLKAHVRRLRQTRDLLGGCGGSGDSHPDPAADVVPERGEEKLLRSASAPSESVHKRPTMAMGIVSSIAVALVVGFLAGSMLVHPENVSVPSIVSAVDEQSPTQQTVRSEAPPRPGRVASPKAQPSLSGDKSFGPRSASPPLSRGDTLRTSATITTMGE
jgi:anti-sigma factor RsiW